MTLAFHLVICVTIILTLVESLKRTPLDNIVHMSYLRLKCAPSILWHQQQAHQKIDNATQDALEREELNQYAHENEVFFSVIDAFFKAQQEANLLLRYSCLGSNISSQITPAIIRDYDELKLKLTTISKVMLENIGQAEDDLIGGHCRDDLAAAITKEVDEWKLDQLHETAITRALGYLIDICQLHFTWVTGSPERVRVVMH